MKEKQDYIYKKIYDQIVPNVTSTHFNVELVANAI